MHRVQRRDFLIAVGALVAAPLAEAQPTAKVPRIGYLSGDLAAGRHLKEGLLQGLRDLGYVELRLVDRAI